MLERGEESNELRAYTWSPPDQLTLGAAIGTCIAVSVVLCAVTLTPITALILSFLCTKEQWVGDGLRKPLEEEDRAR
jgi:ABC-type dipeptide/oligopeptide/nickel transport system permease subunit